MRTHTLGRGGIGLVAGLTLALAAPLAASAHVGIDPAQAEPGEPATFTFTAPNESDTASTIRLEVELPTDTPILSVRYAPLPGWTIEVVESDLPESVDVDAEQAPTRIILTADDGNGLRPGQFLEWTVSFGPIPDTGQISFPVTETYDDGEVVEWDSTPAEVEEDSNLRPALPDHEPCLHVQTGLVRINGLFRHGWLLAPALVDDALERCGLRAPMEELAA